MKSPVTCSLWSLDCLAYWLLLAQATAPPKSWIERNGSWNIWKAFSGCVINYYYYYYYSYYMFPVTYCSTIEKPLLFFGGWFKAVISFCVLKQPMSTLIYTDAIDSKIWCSKHNNVLGPPQLIPFPHLLGHHPQPRCYIILPISRFATTTQALSSLL